MGKSVAFRRLMVCAPSSGSGKTLITCALLRILERHGFKPVSYKCGPDYIDPMFHRSVLGIPSRNLDLLLAGQEGVRKSLIKGAKGRDFGILEGVMGFYDGAFVTSSEYSSYDICCKTGTPAVLVINCRGMSNSIIPVVKGFYEYGDEKRIKGVILNNTSPKVAKEIFKRLQEEIGVPVIGFLPHLRDVNIESRHLGLIMPEEIDDLLEIIDRVADRLEENLDFESLKNIAESAELLETDEHFEEESDSVKTCETDRIRIGIARDEAFCFYYDDNLELLQEMGAELVPFSPLHDKEIPDVSRLIIGGGYPELYAKELSENTTMLRSIREAAVNGMPVLAECGGFLYLQDVLKDTDGNEFKMVGVLSGESHMTGKLSHFGYVILTENNANPYLQKGEEICGHEFHYYDTTDNGEICLVRKPSGNGSWYGYRCFNKVFAGFAHLYYPSCRTFIKRFLYA